MQESDQITSENNNSLSDTNQIKFPGNPMIEDLIKMLLKLPNKIKGSTLKELKKIYYEIKSQVKNLKKTKYFNTENISYIEIINQLKDERLKLFEGIKEDYKKENNKMKEYIKKNTLEIIDGLEKIIKRVEESEGYNFKILISKFDVKEIKVKDMIDNFASTLICYSGNNEKNYVVAKNDALIVEFVDNKEVRSYNIENSKFSFFYVKNR